MNVPVSFDASGSSDAESPVRQYRFDFGDGTEVVSGVARAEHTYAAAGTYSVTLTVFDDERARGTTTVQLPVSSNRIPVATFDGPVLARIGQEVTFDGSNSRDDDGNLVEFAWDFGDDSTAGTNVVEKHTFATAGVYDVALTVTDNDGDTATVTRAISVRTAADLATEAPVALLSVPSQADTNQVLTFDASASKAPGATAAYKVYFGDGGAAAGRSVNHAYTSAGNYTALLMLMATYPDGSTNVAIDARQVSVTAQNNANPAPTAAVAAPASTRFGQTIVFDASQSQTPGATSATYAWDFGDGNNGAGKLASHAYATAGVYIARLTLTVTYSDGTQNTSDKSIVVTVSGNTAPVAALSNATTALASQAVAFDSTGSVDADGTIASRTLDFGDGSPISTESLVAHVYTAAGSYTATLTVTDNDGATSTLARTVTVKNYNAVMTQPRVALNGPSSIVVGQTATFAGALIGAEGAQSIAYKLYFGDGQAATQQTAGHAFVAAGQYEATVLLTATYPDGTTAIAVAALPVDVKAGTQANAAPVASFSAPATARFSEVVNVDASASTAPGATSVQYSWDFGDSGAGSGITAGHQYAAGTYTIGLTVVATYSDGSQATAVASRVVSVTANAAPVAALVGNASGLTSDVFTFDASGSADTDGRIVATVIDFGDGNNAAMPAATHAYSAPGNYTVTVTVTDSDGATASTSKLVTVRSYSTAFAVTAALTGSAQLTVQQSGVFSTAGSTAPGASSVTYKTYFGDGAVALGATTAHAYAAVGNYAATVLVTAGYPDGTTNTATATFPVVVVSGTQANVAPVASFSAPATVRFSEVVNVDASASTAPGATSVQYNWDFGDTGGGSGITAGHQYTAGTYTIGLTVVATYSDGSQATAVASRVISVAANAAPVAALVGDDSGYTSDVLAFDATGSADADGLIVSTVIDFGDGNSAAMPAATHVYSAPGSYTVTVTVTDNDGATASTSKLVTVRSYSSVFAVTAALTGPAQLTAQQNGVFTTTGSAAPGASSLTYKTYFGDGATALGATTGHAYTAAGSYAATVLVTASYPDGTTNTATAVYPVVVISGAQANAAPTPAISAPSSARFGSTVLASAAGSSAPGAASVAYAWDFGDGNTASGVSASNAYAAGSYLISLTVTATYADGSVNTATATKAISVSANTPPTAALSGDGSGLASQALGFDASASSDADGRIVTTTIDFGDGNATSAPVATHTYAAPGTYTVRATVVDNDGASASVIKVVTIRSYSASMASPVAALSGPTQLVVAQSGAFSASGSSAPGAASTAFKLDFGDAATSLNVADAHAYATAGTYLVRVLLTATYPDGSTNTATATLPVAVKAGSSSFAAPAASLKGPTTIRFSETANFDASASSAPGATAAFKWYFGDGATAMGATASHTYAAGSYPVTVLLTATYSDGTTATAVASQVLTVNPNAAPTALLTGSTQGTAGDVLSFDGNGSSDADGSLVSFLIDFGDGSPASTAAVASHGYANAGTYTVSLTVTDNDGATDTTTRLVTIQSVRNTVAAPVASFTAPSILRFSDTAQFDGSASSAPGAASVAYKYYFGDGATALGQSATHVYAPGVYSAVLLVTASYGDGTTNTAVTSHVVAVAGNTAPVATLVAPTTGLSSNVLSFDATGSFDADGLIASYAIDFGDGSPLGSAAVVSHAYAAAGDYTVSVMVTDNDGATATATRVVSVQAYNTFMGTPVAVLNGPTQLVVGDTGVYTASGSTAPGAAVTYRMYFGDGSFADGYNTSHAYAAAGNYLVTLQLTATYPDGTTNTASSVLPVEVLTPAQAGSSPTARFTAPTIIRPSTLITLDGSASVPGSGWLTTYEWDLGDGRAPFVAAASVNVTYPTRGLYTISLTVTNSDGIANTAQRQISVLNNAPSITSVSLSAGPYNENTLIQVTPNGWYDADGDAPGYVYVWYVNGVTVADNTDKITGAYFNRGDTVQAQVYPWDGYEFGNPVWSSVITIDDTPPTFTRVDLSLAPYYEASTITATPQGWYDVDGDPQYFYFDWYVNTTWIGTTYGDAVSSSLDGAAFNHGDQVYVLATPFDGALYGPSVASAVVTISNTPPVMVSAAINGPAPYDKNSTLSLSLASTDIDGDSVGYQTYWYVNGSLVSAAATLSGVAFARGDTVATLVTPNDGMNIGAPMWTAPVTIGNTPPVMTAVNLSAAPYLETSTITATPTATDADAADNPVNPANYTYAWFVNGAPVTSGTGAAFNSLTGTYFDKGDDVYVRVRYNDGFTSSAALDSATVTIGNSAPVMTAINGQMTTVAGAKSINASDSYHTCAITPAGGVKCWGYNNMGQLGDGTNINRSTPVDVVGLSSGVVQVEASGLNTCALLATGGVKCWGANSARQLGDGTTTPRSTPVDVIGLSSGVAYVGVGSLHACALTTGGGVKCWGDNTYGKLGDGTNTPRSTVVDVVGASYGVAQLSVGHEQTCILTKAGGVKCWGSNGAGRLGDGTTIDRYTPVDVVGLSSGIASIHTGVWNDCAVTTTGVGKCWGYNAYGGIGDGTQTTRLTPVDVTVVSGTIAKVLPDWAYTCALLTSGSIECWGDNGYGNLGNGNTTPSYTSAVTVSGITNADDLLVGHDHACAHFPDDSVKCWGRNDLGNTGDGTFTANRTTPVTTTGLTSVVITSSGRLSNDPVYETSTLTAVGLATDVDPADLPTNPANFAYAWFVNGAPVGVTLNSLDGADFDKGDEVKVAVSYTDNSAATSALLYSATVTIQNTAPTLDSATIASGGSLPYSASATFYVSGYAGLSDLDPADTAMITVQWYVNGLPVFGQTGRTLPAGYAAKGDEVFAQVTPYDGEDYGWTVNSNAATVGNTPPTVAMVDFGSGPYYQSSTLTANIAGYDDVDGDPLAGVAYKWFVNGVSAAVTQSLSSGFAKGNTVTVFARVSDGADFSAWVQGGTVTIQNNIPSVSAASIVATPSPATEQSVLTVSYTATDADSGDTLTPHYAWYVNGSIVSVASSLSGTAYNKGDVVSASVQVDDGTNFSNVFATGNVTIQNAAPTSLGFVLAPAQRTTAGLWVQTTAASTDPDPADTVTVSFAWYKNGALQGYPAATTLVPFADLEEGDTWKVIASPSDGFAAAATTFAQTTLSGWVLVSANGAPAGRSAHTAVWTGSEMIVWGGDNANASARLNTGARYNPSTDTWLPTASTSLSGRRDHRAVWTGTEMVVWGGLDNTNLRVNDGARYEPSTDQWFAMAATSMAGRVGHAMVWTGSKVVVWAGVQSSSPFYLGDGGQYDPNTDTWTSVAASPLGSRYSMAYAWTGKELLAWGGFNGGWTNNGARYNPVTNSWATMAAQGIINGREVPVSVFTGSKFVIWGGYDGSTFNPTGVVYDVAADSWSAITGTNAPANAFLTTAVWTGREMIVWAGAGGGNSYLSTGSRYDPQTDTWSAMGASSLSGRQNLGAVWTGREAIYFGGWTGSASANDGARYEPPAKTEAWVATDTADPDLPSARTDQAAVWTGSEMIVWGGWNGASDTNTGGRYNPTTNSWLPTSTGANVPAATHLMAYAWIGGRMVVWGGTPSVQGGRYDPTTDSWATVSTTNQPSGTPRYFFAFAASEKQLFVWGGFDGVGYPNDGGLYDPATDTWTPTGSAGVSPPIGRHHSRAVWTGREFVVWGGHNGGTVQSPGYAIDASTLTWRAISSVGAPASSNLMVAVSAGGKMLVYGGDDAGSRSNAFSQYDAEADAWTTLASPPIAGRTASAAVWTGRELLLWGGSDGTDKNDGYRYDPRTDKWATMLSTGAPAARLFYYPNAAVWTGREMIVWGGWTSATVALDTGARYTPPRP